MASRTNIFLKCQKWIFCCNITHRLWIALQLKFSFQYVIQRMWIFIHFINKRGKSLKAKPTILRIALEVFGFGLTPPTTTTLGCCRWWYTYLLLNILHTYLPCCHMTISRPFTYFVSCNTNSYCTNTENDIFNLPWLFMVHAKN